MHPGLKELLEEISGFCRAHAKRLLQITIPLLVLFLFYLFCLHFTEPTEIGIMRNEFTGEVTRDKAGWNLTVPWVRVAKMDTRPMRVCITSTTRGYNCRLVEFVPEAYQEFVRTEGFRYYWFANRFSFNWGYSEEYRGVKDILRGYGYSAKPYSFVRVIREYEEGE